MSGEAARAAEAGGSIGHRGQGQMAAAQVSSRDIRLDLEQMF